jgi:hypothetical protein
MSTYDAICTFSECMSEAASWPEPAEHALATSVDHVPSVVSSHASANVAAK